MHPGLPALLVVASALSAADGGAPRAESPAEAEARFLQKERRDCEAGDLMACLRGASRPQSESERLRLYEKACELGEWGCVDLAYALAGGHNRVPVDVPRARALAERLCQDATEAKDVGAACAILAQLETDPKRVHALLVRTCEHGWAGYHLEIYSNYWLAGVPKFHANCGDLKQLGKPYPRRKSVPR
jgi:hypothetical protein